MAVTEVISEEGQKSYTVYVNVRSRIMPHIRFQKRVRRISNRAEAVKLEKKLIKELMLKVSQQEGHGYTWRMVIQRWVSVVSEGNLLEKSYSKQVISDYQKMMFKWTKSWLDIPASELTIGHGREVLNIVIEQGHTKGFQKKVKNTINTIYKWGIEYRHIRGVSHSPVHGLRVQVKSEKRPEILKKDEITQLLSEAKEKQPVWYYVWAMALMTGMRNGELYALRWSEVDFAAMQISVERSYNFKFNEFKSTKAGYWRTVPISKRLKEILLELKETSRGEFVLPRISEWKNCGQSKILRNFCEEIGITSVRFHTLRACFATHLLGAGVEPMKVMKISGWKQMSTLAIYVRLAGIDEKGVTESLNF